MATRIPTSNLPKYTELVTLEGTSYELGFDWNTRDETWRLSISTSSGDPIVKSIKILPGVNLTGRFKDVRLPEGDLICLNTKDSITPPDRITLLEEVKIFFLSSLEISLLSDGFVEVI